MKTEIIPACEAQKKFFEILQKLQKGYTFIITENGLAVGKLAAAPTERSPEELKNVREAFKMMEELRASIKLNPPGMEKITIRDLIEEGRR